MAIQFTEIDGITFKDSKEGVVTAMIHVEDLIKAISSLPTRSNGTVVLVARKRWMESSLGHTHWKPIFIPENKCEKATE